MSDIMMNQLSLNSQLLQQSLDTGARISEMAPKQAVNPPAAQPHYAVKGDDAYVEEMDANGDGTITYDEYMEYCKQNAVSNNNSESGRTVVQRDAETIRPLQVGRAFETYARAEASGLPQSMIFNEA